MKRQGLTFEHSFGVSTIWSVSRGTASGHLGCTLFRESRRRQGSNLASGKKLGYASIAQQKTWLIYSSYNFFANASKHIGGNYFRKLVHGKIFAYNVYFRHCVMLFHCRTFSGSEWRIFLGSRRISPPDKTSGRTPAASS